MMTFPAFLAAKAWACDPLLASGPRERVFWSPFWKRLFSHIKSTALGFPDGPVVKNPPCNAGDTSSMLGPGTKIPHASGQLSLWGATTAVYALQQEKPTQWEAATGEQPLLITARESPHAAAKTQHSQKKRAFPHCLSHCRLTFLLLAA